jgi:beta-lactamase class A
MTIPSALDRERASPLPSKLDVLREEIASIGRKSDARAISVALHDIETGAELHYEADRWFHGASTIKVAILLAVYGEIDRGRLVPQSRLHVRNRFI